MTDILAKITATKEREVAAAKRTEPEARLIARARAAPAVLAITQQLVAEGHITTLMVTHNMEHAIEYGTRLIMMHAGRIVLDIAGEQKSALSVPELIERFEHAAAERFVDDRLLLRP